MKNAKITLRNSFHRTRCTVLLPEIYKTHPETDPWGFIEFNAMHCRFHKRRMQRVKRLLCGAKGCQCGVVRG